RANGHSLVVLMDKYAESKRTRLDWDSIRSSPSLRDSGSGPNGPSRNDGVGIFARNLFPHCIGDRAPDLILQRRRRWAWNRHRGPDALFAAFDQPQHPDFAIGVIEVAAAIMARDRRPDAGDLIFGVHHSGVFQIGREQRALVVEIGADVVRDRCGVFADADAAILGRRAEPDRALFFALVQRLPVTHMVAAIGAGPDRLFIGEILA